MASNKNLDIFRGGNWNPVREVGSLQRGIDRLFDDFFNVSPSLPQWSQQQMNFYPAVDVEEQDDHFLVSMDLPGVKKEDVKIEMRDNQLMVSGERHEEHEEHGKHRRFMERSHGSFMRSFVLPQNVDPEKIEADYQDGVLRIALPKSAVAQGRTIQIGGQKAGGLLTRLMSGRQQQQGKKVAS